MLLKATLISADGVATIASLGKKVHEDDDEIRGKQCYM